MTIQLLNHLNIFIDNKLNGVQYKNGENRYVFHFYNTFPQLNRSIKAFSSDN